MSLDGLTALDDADESDSELGTNYVFKYVRFLHAQMSANPPSVLVRPTSSDELDKQAADAGDRILRHAIKDKGLQEIYDQTSLKALIRGTGWIKAVWDPDAGDIFDFNKETLEATMTGDIRIYSPATWDIWVDPHARRFSDIQYTFERLWLSLEKAIFLFPEKEKILRATVSTKGGAGHAFEQRLDHRTEEDMVQIYEYYERAEPINGNAGRYALHLDDGTLLRPPPDENPHYKQQIPLHILTDIDVEDTVYGKSTVEYIWRNQEILNRFDAAAVDAMHAHGVIRVLVPEGAELNSNSMSNSNFDILPYSGNIPPSFMTPPALPPDMNRLRQQMALDIQEIAGVNDAQLGIQRRETSGFSQQTSIEAGNLIRRRLFNKMAAMVERVSKSYLGMVKEHWSEKRQILVLGKEKSYEARALSKADLSGGFDLIVEHGQSLPIDPNMRREQLLLLEPFLEKAGVDTRTFLSMLKLNDLEGVYDMSQLGAARQSEVFQEMIALVKGGTPRDDAYIAPEDIEDHENMLSWAQQFRMSAEYRDLVLDAKLLVDRHIRDRIELAKSQTSTAPEAGAAPAAPALGLVPGT